MHRSRSLLTILGIVIGITSIILILAIGKSAQDLIVREVQSFGPKNVFIIPGREPKGFTGISGAILNDSLHAEDIDALRRKENVPDAVTVMPYMESSIMATHGTAVFSGPLIGGEPELQRLFSLELAQGTFFGKEDVAGQAEVVILGSRVAEKLFDLESPIGQQIKIKDKNYRVIGVLQKKGQGSLAAFDDMFAMPYTTVQQYIMGIRYYSHILVEARTEESIPTLEKDIKRTLREKHNIDDPAKDDFYIMTQKDMVGMLSSVTDILTVFLAAIAAISLIVGGVGIMNIMLVSVTERTQEIGLRKSMGATNRDILMQFLFEAMLLTFGGAMIGMLIGWGGGLALTYVLGKIYAIDFKFFFPIEGALIGSVIAIAIGFIFGIFPARQAARKSPMEALRSE